MEQQSRTLNYQSHFAQGLRAFQLILISYIYIFNIIYIHTHIHAHACIFSLYSSSYEILHRNNEITYICSGTLRSIIILIQILGTVVELIFFNSELFFFMEKQIDSVSSHMMSIAFSTPDQGPHVTAYLRIFLTSWNSIPFKKMMCYLFDKVSVGIYAFVRLGFRKITHVRDAFSD